MGGGLKLAGWGFGGLGALVLVSLIVSMILNDDFSQAPGLVIPGLFCAAGAGLWRLGQLNETDASFDLGHVAKWVFLSVGTVMIVGGVILSFDDPGGLFLVLMGAVFFGAGWFAGRHVATPKGKKKVFVEETTGVVQHAAGGAATVRSGAFIEVDEDATEDEVRAAVDGWRDAMLDHMPGWRTGRLQSNTPRIGALWIIPVIVICIGAGFVAAGWFGDEFLFYFGFLPIGAGLFLLFAIARRIRRLRIFGQSILALKTTPLSPGGVLDAVLEIPAPRRAFSDGRFTLTADCIRQTRSEGAGDRVTYDSQTLWSEQKTHSASGETSLKVKMRFALPDDLPPATLTRHAAAQVRWSLRAEAAGPQAKFLETFDLPVLPVRAD